MELQDSVAHAVNVNVAEVAVAGSSGAGVILTELTSVVTEGSGNADPEAEMPVSQTMENDVPSVITDTQGDGGVELEAVGGTWEASDSMELIGEDGGRD